MQPATVQPSFAFHPRRLLAFLALAAVLGACRAVPESAPDEKVLYPQPPDPPRLQFLRSISRSSQVEPRRSGFDRLLFGNDESTAWEIGRAFGVGVHDGVIWATDTAQPGLVKIDLRAQKMERVPLEGRSRLQRPLSLSFAPDGTLYIADAGRRQVVVLDPRLELRQELGPWGDDSRPVYALAKGDRLYVADAGTATVRVLDRGTGDVLLELGQERTQNEFLRGPTAVAVDDRGYIYVSDTVYSRVYVWDKEGHFVRHIGEPGDIVGQFARPKGLAYVDRTLWVLDTAFENCQIFDLAGNPLMFFGGPGTGPGSMNMPAHIWIGRDGLDLFADDVLPDFEPEYLVVVSNQFGPRKLSFYAFGRSKKFEYPAHELPDVPPAAEAGDEAASPPQDSLGPIKK